jgi:RsiW-degrading membrane proteinase PrsW (M82 family)
MPQGITLFLALSGGILPALLWLWFWLKEDRLHPEPRSLLMLAFVAGMISVPLVIPLEQAAIGFITGSVIVVVWSAIEEIMKYGAGLFVVLRRPAVDEPLDPLIYMITVALGFAALENTLFLLNPDLNLFNGIITGNLRFLGATLLHTLASGVVGLSISLSFYKGPIIKKLSLFIGIVLSIVLHSLFNFFIIKSNGEQILTVFAFVWIGIILLLLSFEKVKRIKK